MLKVRAVLTGFGRRERGVSEIRCKGTMNKWGFANFFAKKIKKKQSEGAGNQIALQKKKDKMSGSDPDARDKEGFLSPQWARLFRAMMREKCTEGG